ncbi:MAG: hypothetical protein ACKVG4_06870 [Longimicrobiales bacterium]
MLTVVVKERACLLIIGLVIGSVGSVFASSVLSGLLFGVSPNDPVTLTTVMLLMSGVGIIAAWVPAARASSVRLVEARRQD